MANFYYGMSHSFLTFWRISDMPLNDSHYKSMLLYTGQHSKTILMSNRLLKWHLVSQVIHLKKKKQQPRTQSLNKCLDEQPKHPLLQIPPTPTPLPLSFPTVVYGTSGIRERIRFDREWQSIHPSPRLPCHISWRLYCVSCHCTWSVCQSAPGWPTPRLPSTTKTHSSNYIRFGVMSFRAGRRYYLPFASVGLLAAAEVSAC